MQLTISRWRSCSAPCTDHRNRNSRLNMHQHHRSLPRKPSLPYSFLGSSLSLHPSHGLALNRYHYTKWLLSLALKLAIERVANEADKWFSAYQFRLYTHRDFIQAIRFANSYWQQPFPTPCSWMGGHGTVPYEQNTQQSSDLGLNKIPQPRQS